MAGDRFDRVAQKHMPQAKTRAGDEARKVLEEKKTGGATGSWEEPTAPTEPEWTGSTGNTESREREKSLAEFRKQDTQFDPADDVIVTGQGTKKPRTTGSGYSPPTSVIPAIDKDVKQKVAEFSASEDPSDKSFGEQVGGAYAELKAELKERRAEVKDDRTRENMIHAIGKALAGLAGLASLRDKNSRGIIVDPTFEKTDFQSELNDIMKDYQNDVAALQRSQDVKRQESQFAATQDLRRELSANQIASAEKLAAEANAIKRQAMAASAGARQSAAAARAAEKENDRRYNEQLILAKHNLAADAANKEAQQKTVTTNRNALSKAVLDGKLADVKNDAVAPAMGVLDSMALGAGLSPEDIMTARKKVQPMYGTAWAGNDPEVADYAAELLNRVNELPSGGTGQQSQQSQSSGMVRVQDANGRLYDLPRDKATPDNLELNKLTIVE